MANISELSAIVPNKLPKTYKVIDEIQKGHDLREDTQIRQANLRHKLICSPTEDLYRFTTDPTLRIDFGINPYDLTLSAEQSAGIPPKVIKLLAVSTIALRMTGITEMNKSLYPYATEPSAKQDSVQTVFEEYAGRSSYISSGMLNLKGDFWDNLKSNTTPNEDVIETFKGPRTNPNELRLAALSLLGLLRAQHRVAIIPMDATDLDKYLETFSRDPLLFN